MGLQIYSNNQSVMAQKYLEASNASLESTVERLSSGLRINHASDDVAGLSISDKFREQVAGLAKATYNAQDAISMLQTAEGGIEVVGDMLQRLRELAVQAGNGTYTANDRVQLQKEVALLKTEINRTVTTTEFNTKKLLTGSASGLWSASSADVEAIIRGAPAEGNYKLNFNIEPGSNAIYKSNIMMNDFYILNEKINWPKGVTDVEVAGIDPHNVTFEIYDGSLQRLSTNPNPGNLLQQFPPANVLTTSTKDLTGLNLLLAEDYRIGGSEGPYHYPVDNFAGYYIGMERVAYAGQTILADDITYGGGGGTSNKYFLDNDGNRVFQLVNNDSSQGFVRMFYMDPSSDVKTYAKFLGVGGSDGYAYMRDPEGISTLDKIEIQFNTTFAATQLVDGDKVVYFHQAGSPDWVHAPNGTPNDHQDTSKMDGIKIFDVNIAPSAGTQVWGGNVIPHIFWDITKDADFNVLTIENGEWKTIKLAWDRDWAIPEDEIGGIFNYDPLTVFGADKIMLKEISLFTNADGRMLLDNTQTVKIYGNDRETEVTLEGADSLQNLIDKLAKAIGSDLQMGSSGIPNQELVRIVTAADTQAYGLNAVPGTIIIQGALTGRESELRFVGDENVLNALGLVQLQEARSNSTSVAVTDAHTGRMIGTDNVADGVIRNVIDGVDVKYNLASSVSARFDERTGRIVFTPAQDTEAYLHVVDVSTKTQVGANEGQKLALSAISQIDTTSLGIDDAMVTTQSDAKSAITKFDQALTIVNRVRATIGAQVSRLEYTMKNISVSRQNMTTAGSRIRDLDVAEESATFARNQILQNASVAMLSQANQLPQVALQLIGR